MVFIVETDSFKNVFNSTSCDAKAERYFSSAKLIEFTFRAFLVYCITIFDKLAECLKMKITARRVVLFARRDVIRDWIKIPEF